MPLVQVSLIEGRTPQQLRALISALTEAVEGTLDSPRSNIRVLLTEIPADHWAAGDVTVAERRSL